MTRTVRRRYRRQPVTPWNYVRALARDYVTQTGINRLARGFRARVPAKRRKEPSGVSAGVVRNFYRKKFSGRAYTRAQHYRGKLRKFSKRPLVNPSYGVKVHHESVGEAVAGAANEIVYVGGSCFAPNTVGVYVMLSVLRKLAEGLGTPFRSGYEFVDNSGTVITGLIGSIRYIYTVGSYNEASERSFDITNVATWYDTASQWWTDLKSGISSSIENVQFKECSLELRTRDVNSGKITPTATLDMTQMLFAFKMTSKLTFQNRTGGNSTTDADSEVVEANPLMGRGFEMSLPYVLFNFTMDAAVTPKYNVDPDSGVIIIDPEEPSLETGLKNMLKRLPDRSAFSRCVGSNFVSLDPGVVKCKSVVNSGKMYFDTFFNKVLCDYAGSGTADLDLPSMGKMHLYAFQKRMRTGTGTAPVTVGYQHDMYMEFQCIQKKRQPFILMTNH